MTTSHKPVGDHLREWRMRRRMSQMDLALEAEISTRHLSFLETGRAQPSREMVLHLADQLEVPLRERNVILVAAGFAPVFPERSLEDPGLAAARRAVDVILKAHEPYPALVVDLRWNLVAANSAALPLLDGVDPEALDAADQRGARLTAPEGPGAADRQPRRMARPHRGTPAPPGRSSPPTPASSPCSRRSAAIPGPPPPTAAPRTTAASPSRSS